jgi:alpha-N-acetylglucosamine transferase
VITSRKEFALPKKCITLVTAVFTVYHFSKCSELVTPAKEIFADTAARRTLVTVVRNKHFVYTEIHFVSLATMKLLDALKLDTFFVMSYFPNKTFNINGWSYSVSQELIPYEISPAQIWETSLVTHIRLVINRFVQTGRANKEISTGRPSEFEDVVEDIRQ